MCEQNKWHGLLFIYEGRIVLPSRPDPKHISCLVGYDNSNRGSINQFLSYPSSGGGGIEPTASTEEAARAPTDVPLH